MWTGLCDFSFPPTEIGTFKPALVVGDSHALIYCTLINRQFMGGQKDPCIRSFIHPTMLLSMFLNMRITCQFKI